MCVSLSRIQPGNVRLYSHHDPHPHSKNKYVWPYSCYVAVYEVKRKKKNVCQQNDAFLVTMTILVIMLLPNYLFHNYNYVKIFFDRGHLLYLPWMKGNKLFIQNHSPSLLFSGKGKGAVVYDFVHYAYP